MDYTEDYYAILGVSRDATQEQIKTAYRSLCKVNHPDVGGDAAMMQLLNKAYVTLSDEILRGKYDAEYSARSNTPPPGTVKAHIINRFGQTSEEYIPINSLKFDIAQYRDENGEIYIYKTQKMNSVIKRTLWYSMYFYHNDPDTIVTCYVYDPKKGIYTAPCPISKLPYDELDRINNDRQLFVICADDDIKFCSSLSELKTEQYKYKRKRSRRKILLSVTACAVCLIMLVGYAIYNPSLFYSIQRRVIFFDAPEGFTYRNTCRIITVNSESVELRNRELTQFEELRLKYYKGLIQDRKYSDLTDKGKQDYIKWVKREVKNGNMDWDIGQEYIDMIKNKEWDFNVSFIEYITGYISDLSDEERERVQDTLNTLATECAEYELNKSYKQYTSAEQDTTDTVYVTQSGKKYHRINCQHVRNKKCTAISRSKAVKKYFPCSKCRP